MEYIFFPGCVTPVRTPNYEMAIRRVAGELDMEIVDLDNFTCCGVPIKSVDLETALLMAARNLTLAAQKGTEVFSGCTGCAAFLTEAKVEFEENPELRKDIAEKMGQLGLEYNDSVRVRSYARVIYEDIGVDRLKEMVKRPLEGLKLAAHYGCHYFKPSKVLAFDDPENPRTLDELIASTGAETVEYENKKLCCGNIIVGIDIDDSLAIAKEKLDKVTAAQADAMVVICPACGLQYDTNQRKIESDYEAKYGLPILYYPQVLGLSLGIGPKELGLDLNRVKPRGLLEKLGIG